MGGGPSAAVQGGVAGATNAPGGAGNSPVQGDTSKAAHAAITDTIARSISAQRAKRNMRRGPAQRARETCAAARATGPPGQRRTRPPDFHHALALEAVVDAFVEEFFDAFIDTFFDTLVDGSVDAFTGVFLSEFLGASAPAYS